MLPAEVDLAVAGPKLKTMNLLSAVELQVLILLVVVWVPLVVLKELVLLHRSHFPLLRWPGVQALLWTEAAVGPRAWRLLRDRRRPRHRRSSTRPPATTTRRWIRCCWRLPQCRGGLPPIRSAVLGRSLGVPRVGGPGPAAAGPRGQRHATSRR